MSSTEGQQEDISNNENDDDDNNKNNKNSNLEQDAVMLEQRLKNLFANQPNKVTASAAEIQKILQRSSSMNVPKEDGSDKKSPSSTDMGKHPNENDTETEGVFLDPDVYANSRDLLGPDGSLNLISTSSPNNNNNNNNNNIARSSGGATAPKRDPRKVIAGNFLESFVRPPRSTVTTTRTSSSGGGGGTSMGDLLDAMQKRRRQLESSDDTEGSEELHRQVLASEEGFQQQSKLFRESLVNSSKSIEAAEFRNGETFRRRHEQAMVSLENQLSEFEASLNNIKVENPCARCGCELTTDEMDHAKKLQTEAICRICLSEDIYRKHKVNDRMSPPSYPAKQYPSSPNSFRPTPYAFTYSQGYSQRHTSSTSTGAPGIPEQTSQTQPTSQSSPEKSSPGPTTQRSRSNMKKPQNRNLQRTSKPVFSPGTSRRRPQRETSSAIPTSYGKANSSDRRDSLPPSNEKFRRKEWVKVEDPDSGEIFYWNTETDEMEWDI